MININTKVVVPTYTQSKCDINKDGTMSIREWHDQYRFKLKDALRYIVDNKYSYMLDDVILYNVPLRDRLREIGMDAFVKEMKDILPGDDAFASYIDDFAETYKNRQLGDFDIQLYADVDDFVLLGHTFHGLKELAERVEMYGNSSFTHDPIWARDIVASTPHVGEIYERYPCFDSEDYATETRSYQNYIVRKDSISMDDMKEVLDKNSSSNCKYVREDMSEDLLPMVYYEGDGGYILVATKKTSRKNLFKILFR